MPPDDIQIRPLYTLQELQEAVDLQRVYWGSSADSVIPTHMLFSIVTNGGHVLAAQQGDNAVGVLVGLIGVDTDAGSPKITGLHIHSKRMVVLPDYRHYGLGTRLKFAQRDYAIQQGINRVVWTFDPLLSRNAYLNISKLGATSRRFLVNYYGTDNIGGLSPMGYSDRLYAEWWVGTKAVEARANGEYHPVELSLALESSAVLVNPAQFTAGNLPEPGDLISPTRDGPFTVLIEIPWDFPHIMSQDKSLARAWREHNRASLGEYVKHGYHVVDFVSGDLNGRQRSFYVLNRTTDESETSS